MYTLKQIIDLEKCLDDLSLAIARQDEFGIYAAIDNVNCISPSVVNDAKKQIQVDNGLILPIEVNIRSLHDDILIANAKGYEKVLHKTVQGYYSQKISARFIRCIYYNSKPFEASTVIYREDEGEFNVADLLSVAGYVVKIAESISPDKRTESASAAITVFKGIELALNNNKTEQPIRKLFHFANDFLTSVVKSHIKEDEGKSGVVVTSIMVDLVIDFFIKG